MESMSEIFHIVLFTAARPEYALHATSYIDKERKYIKRTLYRDDCTKCGIAYVKDLEKAGFDVQSTLIVDNKYNSFGFHPKNGIKCKSYYGDDQDTELLRLEKILLRVDLDSGDLRTALQDVMRESSGTL